MAQGDIRSAFVSIPASTYVSVQPGAGEHWIMKNLASQYWGGSVLTEVRLYNGTFQVLIFPVNSTPPTGVHDLLAGFWTQSPAENKAVPAFEIGINNGLYLRVRNGSGAEQRFVYTAVQIK